jgi:DNA-binding transcriptional LysR family regulator
MSKGLGSVTLADLRTFTKVARALSVTGAAELLGVPKSAVSKSLSRLEAALDVRLLERSSRRVSLTQAGALLVPKAESLIGEAESITARLREERHDQRGLVRMTATPESGTYFAERVAPILAREHPGLHVALTLGYEVEDLLDPAIDLALRVGGVHDDRLVAHRLAHFRLITVASPAYATANPVRSVSDLGARSCLVFSPSEARGEWSLSRGEETARVTVSGALAVRSFAALLHAARSGLGVAMAPEPLTEEWLRRGDLVRVLPEWSSRDASLFVVHRVGHQRIARVAAVLRALRAHPWFGRGG